MSARKPRWRQHRARDIVLTYGMSLGAFGCFALIAAGGGHGILWPFAVWMIAALPVSLLVVPVTDAGAVLGNWSFLIVALMPLANALLWLFIVGVFKRYRRRPSRHT